LNILPAINCEYPNVAAIKRYEIPKAQ